MDFSLLFPATFPALAFAHFVALLSPGQDFFLILGHSARYRLKGSGYICVGVALGNAIYIAIAILGWTAVRDNAIIFSTIQMLGAGYLLWIGTKLLTSKPDDTQHSIEVNAQPSIIKQLLLGLNSALLNPKNALFYMSLMAVILGHDVTLIQQIATGIWMFLAVLCWDLTVAATIALPHIQRHFNQSIHRIERGAGAILIIFAISLFVL